ncbi:MAG: serine/threonine-protein kinase [Polyangiaceae bacterium]
MTDGRIIGGRYQLLAKLGQGGMGSVHRATHLELGTPVAIKLIDPIAAESKSAVARFRREAQAAASIRSANVVQILDFGIDEETPYIVMELLEGESLAARISREHHLNPQATVDILGQVGKALERAHGMNIVHRDLKPDNVLLVRDGADWVAKVLDFGIAKIQPNALFSDTVETRSGALLGTPHYMSPEQASGRGNIDHRSDVWSLGVIAFECLTGFRPFTGATLGGVVMAICSEPMVLPSERGSVPRGFDAWFLKACSRELDSRFSSMSEALDALRLVCSPGTSSVALATRGIDTHRTNAVSSSGPDETVTPSARTVSTEHKRRPWTIGIMSAVLAFGVSCAMLGGRWLLHTVDSSIASRGASSSPLNTRAGSSPSVVGFTAAASGASSSASGRAATGAAEPRGDTSAPLGNIAKRAAPVGERQNEKGASSLPVKPQASSETMEATIAESPRVSGTRKVQSVGSAGGGAVAEPKRDPAPAQTSRNVEDRLAF